MVDGHIALSFFANICAQNTVTGASDRINTPSALGSKSPTRPQFDLRAAGGLRPN